MERKQIAGKCGQRVSVGSANGCSIIFYDMILDVIIYA